MNMLRSLTLGILLVAIGCASYKVMHQSAIVDFRVTKIDSLNNTVTLHSHFVSTQQNISTHASSLIELKDGRIRAFWFSGSREGAEDVEIVSAVFDGQQWSNSQRVINREYTQQGLARYVKKLGNPVAVRTNDGLLRLYFVTVSVGGWAGSSITSIFSRDEGNTWSAPQRLITSPFINISTLIKGAPIAYQDGSIGLPVYHEFLGKFGEILHISDSGQVLDKQRLSFGKTSIQPIVLVQDNKDAVVLMRYTGSPPNRVLISHTNDAGQHWDVPSKLKIANPDAAVAGVALANGQILAVLNNQEAGRNTLSLMLSPDRGLTWQTLYMFEDQPGTTSVSSDNFEQINRELAKQTETGLSDSSLYAKSAQKNKCVERQCEFEFSYPYLIRARNGDFHLVYTWNRSFIKHVQFSLAWVDALKEKGSYVNPQ